MEGLCVEHEFVDNYQEMTKLMDIARFGELKNNAHELTKEIALVLHKKGTVEQTQQLLEQVKQMNHKEKLLKEEISDDKEKKIIETTPEILELQNKLNELTQQRKEYLNEHTELLEKFDSVLFDYDKVNTMLNDFEKKNELMGKFVSMKGDLDEGILVCNKQIIPFDVKKKDLMERKQYLCQLILDNCKD